MRNLRRTDVDVGGVLTGHILGGTQHLRPEPPTTQIAVLRLDVYTHIDRACERYDREVSGARDREAKTYLGAKDPRHAQLIARQDELTLVDTARFGEQSLDPITLGQRDDAHDAR